MAVDEPLICFRIIHWYLFKGDDWMTDEIYLVMYTDESDIKMVDRKPDNVVVSNYEVSIARGAMDFNEGLVGLRTQWPKVYQWLAKRFKEPERMKGFM